MASIDCILIGGTSQERQGIAAQLRRRGICVDTELRDGSKAKARKRANKATAYGSSIVYDLDHAGDRRYVSKPWAFRDREWPSQPAYSPPQLSAPDRRRRIVAMVNAGYAAGIIMDTFGLKDRRAIAGAMRSRAGGMR